MKKKDELELIEDLYKQVAESLPSPRSQLQYRKFQRERRKDMKTEERVKERIDERIAAEKAKSKT